MAGINFTDEQEYSPKLKFRNTNNEEKIKTMAKHTQGNWIAEILEKGNPSKNIVIYTLEKPEGILNIYPSEEAEANAKLISAAPELLEALKAALNILEAVSIESQAPHTIDIVKKAIKKATN